MYPDIGVLGQIANPVIIIDFLPFLQKLLTDFL